MIEHFDDSQQFVPGSTKKSPIILNLFFFGMILISIVIAGMFGKNFLSFFMFYMFFGFPLMIIYKKNIIAMLPENISSRLVSDIQSINEELQDDGKNTNQTIKNVSTSKKNQELFVVFLGSMCYILSIYIFIKRRFELTGMAISFFFCIISNIIIGDLF
jgi:hypothetical protein